ncbi:hypothetical protein QJQ45_009070 [Haematococcus lacustris]|nr:hypothetical protein QJQ45_009070 [Haematococcus lacustris]
MLKLAWDPLVAEGPPPISSRFTKALQTRTEEVGLTLVHRPDQVSPAQDSKLVAEVLAALGTCPAVGHFAIGGRPQKYPRPAHHLFWTPCRTELLLQSFPKLLSFQICDRIVPAWALGGPAGLLTHPQLCPQLEIFALEAVWLELSTQPGPSAVTLDNLFEGSQLQHLCLNTMAQVPNLLPLAEHLTLLELTDTPSFQVLPMQGFLEMVSGLVRLKELHAEADGLEVSMEGFPQLLQALPKLETLHLPRHFISGTGALDALLAATQLTGLLLGGVADLTKSRATSPCSWLQLELKVWWLAVDSDAIACLPLHSLTYQLDIARVLLTKGVPQCAHNLLQRCKAPVSIGNITVDMAGDILMPLTPAEEQQARQQAAAVVAAGTSPGAEEALTPAQRLVQLQGVKVREVTLRNMPLVTEGAVAALVSLGLRPTAVEFYDGSLVGDLLGFWLGLVAAMPAVAKVTFTLVEFDLHTMERVLKQMEGLQEVPEMYVVFQISQEVLLRDTACWKRMINCSDCPAQTKVKVCYGPAPGHTLADE